MVSPQQRRPIEADPASGTEGVRRPAARRRLPGASHRDDAPLPPALTSRTPSAASLEGPAR
jgi:hypothetical protein